MEVTFKDIRKSYGNFHAVKDLNLTIKKGALHFLLGPSGCGKTTTLRMLAGLETVSSGQILFNGQDVTKFPAAERGIGMVFQNYALWPHMTVRQNIEYGLQLKKLSSSEIKSRLDDVLSMTQLTNFVERHPGQLSGGQQQRVALARALAIRPHVLLLDEPLSNLDTKLRLEMRENISRIHQETGITTVYVTHDQKEALSMGTHITVMHGGKQMQSGMPRDLYMTPNTPFVAGFIGETNLVEGRYTGITEGLHTVETSLGVIRSAHCAKTFQNGDSVVVSMRPESIKVKLPDRDLPKENVNLFHTTVGNFKYLGEYEQLDLLYGQAHLTANIFNVSDYDFTPKSKILCFIRIKDVVVLPPDTHMGPNT